MNGFKPGERHSNKTKDHREEESFGVVGPSKRVKFKWCDYRHNTDTPFSSFERTVMLHNYTIHGHFWPYMYIKMRFWWKWAATQNFSGWDNNQTCCFFPGKQLCLAFGLGLKWYSRCRYDANYDCCTKKKKEKKMCFYCKLINVLM